MDETLARIEQSLEAAKAALSGYTPGKIAFTDKGHNDPVTAADHAVNAALKATLLREGEGWLSEETYDDRERLKLRNLWVIDPIDGTKEFVAGVPEWAVSVGRVEDGRPVAGGVYNVQTGEKMVGNVAAGATYNGAKVHVTDHKLEGALILASRTEMSHGDWLPFAKGPFRYTPVGSIAYKLELVAAGKADATFTLTPKNEWDVAGGVALLEAAGGRAVGLDGNPLGFNRANTLYHGVIAGSPRIVDELLELLTGLRLLDRRGPPDSVRR